MSDEQNVVQVRVQVIDMKSFTLDLQVPTYLPARDLTQRVARDAGLDSHWDDGRRRLYWLRARGRLMGDDEKLSDLGVVNNELVYLLPEPPAGSGVLEQPPDYPQTHDYAGAGTLALLGSLSLVLLWAVGWGIALSQERSIVVVSLPGLAMGLFCTSFARHAWGGAGNQLRIVATGLFMQLMITIIAFLAPVLLVGADVLTVYQESVPGLILGLLGVFIGWLAWWGAVEPLPPKQQQQFEQAPQVIATVPCGICGLGVEQKVRVECQYVCGQYFHQGCYKAKVAVYRGDKSKCAICTRKVA
ncbi:MAG: EsaB/YukD family protein [Pseudomonadota bacterium]|nr:EsaB/YukD family protein [Pseudomonadota bacterium]